MMTKTTTATRTTTTTTTTTFIFTMDRKSEKKASLPDSPDSRAAIYSGHFGSELLRASMIYATTIKLHSFSCMAESAILVLSYLQSDFW